MRSVKIEFKAPFLSYRAFNSGNYQYTLPVIPPSSAYGIICGLGGIEIKDYKVHRRNSIKSQLYYGNKKEGLPSIGISVGIVSIGGIGNLTHQHHQYVTTSSRCPKEFKTIKELEKSYYGRKFSISIVHREYIMDFHGAIGVRGDKEFINKVCQGIEGCIFVPYAGQSNLFFSDIREGNIDGVRWYDRESSLNNILLPVKVVRHSVKECCSVSFGLSEVRTDPPESSWVEYGDGGYYEN